MADFLMGYDPRIDTAPDFADQPQNNSYRVTANVPPVAGPGNAHPNHHAPTSDYAGATENPTYAGTLYPTGQ